MVNGTENREYKILILAIVNDFPGAVEYGEAVEILSRAMRMPIMELTDYIISLEDARLLRRYPRGDKMCLGVTNYGQGAAMDALPSIRYIDVDAVMERARYEYDRVVNGISYSVELVPSEEDGGCVVDYICKSRGKLRCRVSVFYSSFAHADAALKRIEDDPVYFRRYISMYLDRER